MNFLKIAQNNAASKNNLPKRKKLPKKKIQTLLKPLALVVVVVVAVVIAHPTNKNLETPFLNIF
jgi:hypothetical protein